MKCECGFEFDFEGVRNFEMRLVVETGQKIIICPECGKEYI